MDNDAFSISMKKNIYSIILSVFLVSLSVSAQSTDKTVEKIRSYYSDIAEKARLCEDAESDAGEIGDLVMNELVVNKRGHQWRVVGTHVLTYKFFYGGGNSEEHMYPDRLVMVKTERRESNRAYAEEFLYSEAGVLMFYFQKAENDTETPAERRVYFSGIKPIRVVEDGKTRNKLTAKDLRVVKEITAANEQIKAIFARSIKL